MLPPLTLAVSVTVAPEHDTVLVAVGVTVMEPTTLTPTVSQKVPLAQPAAVPHA